MKSNILFKPAGIALVTLLIFSACSHQNTGRMVENFNANWKFHHGNLAHAESADFDDSDWRVLNLPHDWSIEGAFNKNNPSKPSGGALPGGVGWYRKSFKITTAEREKLIFIDFDGVYCNSEVWINGHYLGLRPYGYSSFRYELTPYLNYGTENNIIAVKVDNSKQPNSRWYSGSGIYRNVRLVTTGKIFVDHWGTHITTPVVTPEKAQMIIETNIRNRNSGEDEVQVETTLLDSSGQAVAKTGQTGFTIPGDSTGIIKQELSLEQPLLWSVDHPYLYNAVTILKQNGKIVDRMETPVGFRFFSFDPEKGFFLNGKSLKILGVCNHHDLGSLGAAVNYRALERQLELLKEMGCNGIRTSHNPPAPELLELCDKMGFIVLDEAFDMWKKGKTLFDYHLYWDEWHKRDLEDFVLRDRNHPSVMMWSIGNEIHEQSDTSGITIARELAQIVRKLDATRPITSACNHPGEGNTIVMSGALDLIGYNYHPDEFIQFPAKFPGKKLIATETTSAIETRGHYDMPSDSIRRWPDTDYMSFKGNSDYTVSAYDNVSVPWGSTHEETWRVVKKYDYISGLFIWTGFDYLGEPTPYWWPARSSYFGIIDLAGFPKDAFYLYQSEWTDKPVLHLFPHWNWKEGDFIDVWTYTNCSQVELFLNGTSLGVREKGPGDLHLMWHVPFRTGTLKAVGIRNNSDTLVAEVKTAGEPTGIELKADRSIIKSNGHDLSFVTVRIVDQQGNMVPNVSNLVQFELKGPGDIAGVDNGSPISHESFKANKRKAYNGMCLAIIQSRNQSGRITLEARSEGLTPANITIKAAK